MASAITNMKIRIPWWLAGIIILETLPSLFSILVTLIRPPPILECLFQHIQKKSITNHLFFHVYSIPQGVGFVKWKREKSQ